MEATTKKLAIIWDMDGTLIDSAQEIIVTLRKALENNGVDSSLIEKSFRIGPPVRQIIRNSFSEEVLTDTTLDLVVKDFRTIYDTSHYDQTKVFDGIQKVLSNTEKYTHYIITNKPELATWRIAEFKGWKGFISGILTPTSFDVTKTKEELFVYFKETHKELCPICIGDMKFDCLCAKKIGAKTIGVLWGTGTKQELTEAGCDYIVENAAELSNILEEIWEKES